jgi:hypothetical protein
MLGLKPAIIASGDGGSLAAMVASRMRRPMYAYMNTREEYEDNHKVDVVLFYDSLDNDDQYTKDINRLVSEGVQRSRISVVGAVSTYSITNKPVMSFFDMYDIRCLQWVLQFPNVINAGSVENLVNTRISPLRCHTYYIEYVGADDVYRVMEKKRSSNFRLCTSNPCMAADYLLVYPEQIDSSFSTPCILATDGSSLSNLMVEQLLEHPCVFCKMFVGRRK